MGSGVLAAFSSSAVEAASKARDWWWNGYRGEIGASPPLNLGWASSLVEDTISDRTKETLFFHVALEPQVNFERIILPEQSRKAQQKQKKRPEEWWPSFFTIPITLLYLIILKMHRLRSRGLNFSFDHRIVHPDAFGCQFRSLLC